MIQYRTFKNYDCPQLFQLWGESQLGRGAAQPESVDAFEHSTFGQLFFDPQALQLAVAGRRVVGFAHAGFSVASTLDRLDPTSGVVCSVLVHPEFRGQGVGRELFHRAERYLVNAGAHVIDAGPHWRAAPFYFGLYGGCRPSGFLKSDPHLHPFVLAMGYQPASRYGVFQRDLKQRTDPVTMRSVSLRRTTQIVEAPCPDAPTWWWFTQYGRMEAFRFHLQLKTTGQTVAATNVVRLDHYQKCWHERAVGLVDMDVDPAFRGQGYGQTLLIEVARRLRAELVTRIELHVPLDNPIALKAVANAGFRQIDEGVVYRKYTAPG